MQRWADHIRKRTMMPKTVKDKIRGCGWRKPGGLYLKSSSMFSTCGKLPLEIEVCSCCGAGIKPARGWTWIDPSQLFKNQKCKYAAEPGVVNPDCHPYCPINFDTSMITKAGLLWVGEAYYPTPESFNQESMLQGISRRISQIPNDFKLGETWVFLAHRKGKQIKASDQEGWSIDSDTTLEHDDPVWIPTIFNVFKPDAIEYVVDPMERDHKKLDRLEKRGVTLVQIKQVGMTVDAFPTTEVEVENVTDSKN